MTSDLTSNPVLAEFYAGNTPMVQMTQKMADEIERLQQRVAELEQQLKSAYAESERVLNVAQQSLNLVKYLRAAEPPADARLIRFRDWILGGMHEGEYIGQSPLELWEMSAAETKTAVWTDEMVEENERAAEELGKGIIAGKVTDETKLAAPWRCTICRNMNPDDAIHCRQCGYSRTVMRDGKSVPRDGKL